MNPRHTGLLAAVAAFCLWGVLPLYWKQIDFMAPPSIVAHRTLWSLVILTLVMLLRREAGAIARQFRSASSIGWLLVSGSLLAANWILYVWATLNERILEGSLGYYLNPFFNMLFGALWFGERHNRLQGVAIAIALVGVVIQIPAIGRFPWVAITLAVTFSLYAVVKKRGAPGSRAGLTAESTLLAPIAIGWLCWQQPAVGAAFGGSWTHALWLMGTGLATTLPLLCFGYAARNIRLTTLGMVQFIGPSLQLVIGWLVYNEPMPAARIASFSLVWMAIGLYSVDSFRRRRS